MESARIINKSLLKNTVWYSGRIHGMFDSYESTFPNYSRIFLTKGESSRSSGLFSLGFSVTLISIGLDLYNFQTSLSLVERQLPLKNVLVVSGLQSVSYIIGVLLSCALVCHFLFVIKKGWQIGYVVNRAMKF